MASVRPDEWGMFGDGYFALVADLIPDPDDVGYSICKILPTEPLKEAYKLDNSDAERDRITGTYTRRYATEDIIEFPKGVRGRAYLFLCNFEGKKSGMVERLDLRHLSTVRYYREENRRLNLQINKQWKEWRKMLNQPGRFQQQAMNEYLKFAAASKEGEEEGSREGEQ